MRKLTFLFVVGALLGAIALPALAASPATTTTGTTPTGTTPATVSTTPGTTTTTATTPSTGTPPATETTGPARARHPRQRLHRIAGSVSAVGPSSLTVGVLWTGPDDGSLNGQTVTVAVDSRTRINQGHKHGQISLSDIQTGELVSLIVRGDPSSPTAGRIHVYCNCHWIGGTIDSIGPAALQVQVRRSGPYDSVLRGREVTIQVNASTIYVRGRHRDPIQLSDLHVGDGVGVIFAANGFFKAPGFDPSTAAFTARRVHLWGHRAIPLAASDAAAAAGTAVP